jgi:S1-C subfamily serine protease
LVLTAAHVVSDNEIVNVTFNDGKTVKAKVLGCDYDADVALALITEPGEYPFMELGDTKDLAVGDMVVAMGNPGGFDPKRLAPVRYGRVFHFNHGRQIRSDCTLVGGDSGGPLFDLDGKVIGVHSNVSVDISMNNDVPAEIVRKDWDRMVKGERWGHNPLKVETKLTKEDLAGLDLGNFRHSVQLEAMKNNGRLALDPSAISKLLKDNGMKEERVKAMDTAALTAFLGKALEGMAMAKGFNPLDDSNLPKISEEELAGMDLKRFRKRLFEDGMKNGGKLEANPTQVAQWLREAGMKEERVSAMSPMEIAGMVKKALGGIGEVASRVRLGALPKMSEEELAGLDLQKFRQHVAEEGGKSGGKLATSPSQIGQWLRDAGMKEERVSAMKDEEIMGLFKKALGGDGVVHADGGSKEGAKESSPANTTKTGDPELAGLEVDKFRARLIDEAKKGNGKLETTPENLAKWLAECGMDPERLKDADPRRLGEIMKKAMGSGVQLRSSAENMAQFGPIFEQDKEVVAAIKPSLDKLAPSVVSLIDGDKTLAMGTIVRSNGFILTKHSEIAKAKNGLKARLTDGRILPAVEVQKFDEHDLALVKIAADLLPAVTISELREPMTPGKFLFTPGNRKETEMLAMGVVSVKDRSLKESGGYLGIALAEVQNGVGVGEVTPEGPAAKAGLQKDDQILSIDGHDVHQPIELSKFVRALKPETKVQIKYRRSEEEKTTEVTLADRSTIPTKGFKPNPATTIGTEVSDKAAGFPLIFQHDQPLKPEECGSVVVDLHGEVVGVNIARISRVESYAIPAGAVADLLKTVDFEALEKKATESAEAQPKL